MNPECHRSPKVMLPLRKEVTQGHPLCKVAQLDSASAPASYQVAVTMF